MDSSRFLSSKGKLSFWIIFPFFCLVVFYFSVSNYLKLAEISVDQRKAFVELLPIIEQRISVTKKMLESYITTSSETDIIKMINSQLNDIASQTKFIINSLAVEKVGSANSSSKTSIFMVTVKGEGELSKLGDFFDRIFTSDKLIVLERTKVNTDSAAKKDIYSVEIVFFYYDLYY